MDSIAKLMQRKKQAQEVLRERKRYYSLFENMLEGYAYCRVIYEQDRPLDFVYLNVNASFERLTGLKDVVGKKVSDIIPGIRDANPELFEIYGRVALTGNPEKFEIFLDSLEIWLSITVYSNEKETFVAVFDNITERKRASEALRESEEKTRIIAEAAADALISTDNDGNISYWNPAAEKILGYSCDEVMGKPLHFLLASERYHEASRKGFAEFKNSGTGPTIGNTMEFTALKKDGTEIPVEIHVAAVNFRGKWNAIGILRDITERTALRNQLLQAQKMEAVGRLAGGIAHDFNNTMTGIIGFSTLLEMSMDKDDPRRMNVTQIIAAAGRAAELTKSLLTFSREQIINPQPVNLIELIRKIEAFLKRIIGEDIDLLINCQQDSITVNADSGQIEQVLINLATNARDAMPKGGILSIEAQSVEMDEDFIKLHGFGAPGEYALISISDTGMGMDENTRKRLFEPFFTTKELGKGTGLGCSIVYGIIKQHKAHINVYSEPGVGTSFKIYMPVTKAAVREKSREEWEVLHESRETILVADDDPLIRDLLEQVLGIFGYTVITAVDGLDALTKFCENKGRISLVILDVIMSKMNGRESYDEIRKISPGMKVIFMSGYTADIIHKRGILDEELEFLAKPLNPRRLIKKVQDLLHSS